MAGEYYIDFTNKQRTLVIEPQEQNNDTSLFLFGRDTVNWGTYFYSNLIKLLESFCNEYQPGYSGQLVLGQIWYDTFTDKLKVCTHIGNPEKHEPINWSVIANEKSPILTNTVGDNNIHRLVAKLIPLDGTKKRLTGALLLEPTTEDSYSDTLATRHYVDMVADNIPTVDNRAYLGLSGGTLLTTLHLPDDSLGDNYCATKKYVDNHAIFKIEYDNHIGILWDSSAYNTNYDDVVVSRIPRQSSQLAVVNGSIFIKRGRNTCILNMPVLFLTDPNCVVSGGLHDTGDWVDRPSDVTYKILDKRTILFERATVAIDEKIYFTITGICSSNAVDFEHRPVTVNIDGNWITNSLLTATLVGVDADSPYVSYEWYREPNSTTPVARTYQFTPKVTGLYTVRAFYKDANGDTLYVDSEPATVMPAVDRRGAVTVTGASLNGITTLSAKLIDLDTPLTNMSYQWFKDNIPESSSTNITNGSLTQYYTPRAAGNYKVRVIYTDSGYVTSTVESLPYTIAVTPVSTAGYVEISSDPDDFAGTTLTATVHDVDTIDASTVVYQWYLNNVPIYGATSQTYGVPADKWGKYSVKAVYTDKVGVSQVPIPNQVAWSDPQSYQIDPPPRDTLGVLRIAGKQLPNNLQTATLSDPDHVVIGSESWSWWNKGDPSVVLSTSRTFTPVDAGTYVAHVEYNDDFHEGTVKASAETEWVIEKAPLAQIAGKITIESQLSDTGYMVSNLSDPNGVNAGTEQYQWSVNGVEIPGGTGKDWLPTIDKGVYTVCVKYTDGLDKQEHVCSPNSFTYTAPPPETTNAPDTTTGGDGADTTTGGDTTDTTTPTDTSTGPVTDVNKVDENDFIV